MEVEHLTKDKIAEYSSKSSELKYIYSLLFQQWSVDWGTWESAAFEDLSSRGNEAAPALMEAFQENSVPGFRANFLDYIDQVKGISLHPFMEVVREVWKKERLQLDSDTSVAIVWFLASYGEKEDKEILEGMMFHKDMGRVRTTAKDQLLYMTKRLNGTMKATEWHGNRSRIPNGYNWSEFNSTANNQPSELPRNSSNSKMLPSSSTKPQVKSEPSGSVTQQQHSSRNLLVWLAVMITTVTGLSWVFFRKSKS